MPDMTDDEADRCESCGAVLRKDSACRCGPPPAIDTREYQWCTMCRTKVFAGETACARCGNPVRLPAHSEEALLNDLELIRAQLHRQVDYYINRAKADRGAGFSFNQRKEHRPVYGLGGAVGYVYDEESFTVSRKLSLAEVAEQEAEVWRRYEAEKAGRK